MSLSQNEILGQYNSLAKTFKLFEEKGNEILSAIENKNRFVFFGCGSSYYISKSAAVAANIYGASGAIAVAAGDFIVNCEQYKKTLDGTCVVFISRSGKTSEMVIAAEMIRSWNIDCTVLSICATENAPLYDYAKLSIELPWAFDKSVCQTQTVSNLYAAVLLLLALRYKDDALVKQLSELIADGNAFITSLPERLEPLYKKTWSKAVVLSDGITAGIAEEGALAFNELCMLPSNFYHVLDVRHGPMVLIKEGTLVVLLCSAAENTRQLALLRDIKKRGAYTLVVTESDAFNEADLVIKTTGYGKPALSGFHLINVIQLLSLGIATATGIDPDNPDGLDAWIKL